MVLHVSPAPPEYMQLTFPCCFSEGVIPGPPTDLSVTEATRSYVVLSWKPPGQRGHEGIMYFVEKVRPQHYQPRHLLMSSFLKLCSFLMTGSEGGQREE